MIEIVCEFCGKTKVTSQKTTRFCSNGCWKASLDRKSLGKTALTGAASELAVCVDLLRKGYEVFRNVAPCGCDLVISKGELLIKVEVKTTYRHLSTGNLHKPAVQKNGAKILAMVEGSKAIHYVDPETREPIDLS